VEEDGIKTNAYLLYMLPHYLSKSNCSTVHFAVQLIQFTVRKVQ